jgi:hypothetical protein
MNKLVAGSPGRGGWKCTGLCLTVQLLEAAD